MPAPTIISGRYFRFEKRSDALEFCRRKRAEDGRNWQVTSLSSLIMTSDNAPTAVRFSGAWDEYPLREAA